jgi:hypothetical protein
MKSRLERVIGVALALAPFVVGGSLSAAAPPNGGTIALEPRTADGDYDPSLQTFVAIASEALTTKGFTVFDDREHAAYVGELTLSRVAVGTGLAKDPGGASVAVAGTGLVVPFSTGQSNVVTLRRTRLELRILKRDDRSLVWDGTAVTVRSAGTKKGTDEAVAADLSAALLQGYPAQPDDVVGVP